MIGFKEFLAESAHKQELELAEAIKLIETHCKDALKSGRQLYRGMTPGSDAYALHGEASTRKSANTTNYYTVILDHFLPEQGYPKRSASIILANGFDTARGYGSVYAIFPYDNVPIGVCDGSDLWDSELDVGNAGDKMRIDRWNRVWQEYGLSADSYESFVASIKDKMEEGKAVGRMLTDIFESPDGIEPALKKAYSAKNLKMNLATTKTINDFDFERELWIGGKCIAIQWNIWAQLQTEKGQ